MKIKLFTIPNLLTLSSLLCGSFAAVSALVYHDLELTFWLTVAAGVFDYCDGFAARLLKCPSAIGVQLDSLSDMVSFGFVPASVLFVLWNDALAADAEPWMRYGGSVLCFVVAAFSALRLAKFNIDEHRILRSAHSGQCAVLRSAGLDERQDGLQSGRLGAPADAGHVVAAHIAGENVRFQVPEFFF